MIMNRRISILIIASLYLFAGTALANRYNNEDGDERDYFNAGVEIESLWNLTGDDFAVYKAAEAYYEEVAGHGFLSNHGHYPIPEPDNLVEYFAKVPDEIIAVEGWHYEYEDFETRDKYIKDFRDAIKELQLYSEGKLQTFPKEEIYEAFFTVYNTASMLESEGGTPAIWRLLCFRLMEQVVRLCPDIRMLTNMVTDDGRGAIIDLKKEVEENYPGHYQPQFNFIVTTNENGEKILHTGSENRIYRFTNSKGENYYLASSHGKYISSNNDTYLSCSISNGNYFFEIDGEDVFRKWYNGDEDIYYHYRPGEHIVFNPKEICWIKCTQNGDLYHQIEGTEKLYLDIEEIRFYTK